MNHEFLNILNETKEVLGCEVKVTYLNNIFCTNDSVEYGFDYLRNNYKISTSKLLNKQLVDLIVVHFDDYFKHQSDYSDYFNGVIDNQNNDFHYVKKISRSMILIECERPLEVLSMLQEIVTKNEYIFVRDLNHLVMLVVVEDIEKYCLETLNSIEVELMQKAKLSYSVRFDDIAKIPDNYKSCMEALNVGKIFNFRKNVFSTDDNKIEKLFSHIDKERRKNFLNEFSQIKSLNNEEILTINFLFENDLNITKTAKAMYIHRNTLIYRIDKIEHKITLDILNFNDAIMLRVLLILTKIEETF
jgi:sugar diacid utilization regulator